MQQEAGEYTNKLNFIDGTTYEVKNNEIGFVFEEEKFEDIFAKQHKDRNTNRVYGVNDVASLNKGQLAMYLATIPELQQKNMVEPKDAHITWNGNNFDVEKETFGNAIDFNEALDFALQELKGEEEGGIDFSEVTRSNPSVTETDLTARVTYLNNFLKNCINIILSDWNCCNSLMPIRINRGLDKMSRETFLLMLMRVLKVLLKNWLQK